MKNILAISISAIVLIGIVVFYVAKGRDGSVDTAADSGSTTTSDAVTMENGTQYINITAKGGYTPRSVNAKAGTKTVIRMTSAGAFDCSSSVVIPDLDFQKFLQPQETAEIPVPLEKTKGRLQGLCAMGMYNFVVNFI